MGGGRGIDVLKLDLSDKGIRFVKAEVDEDHLFVALEALHPHLRDVRFEPIGSKSSHDGILTSGETSYFFEVKRRWKYSTDPTFIDLYKYNALKALKELGREVLFFDECRRDGGINVWHMGAVKVERIDHEFRYFHRNHEQPQTAEVVFFSPGVGLVDQIKFWSPI